MRKTHDWFRKPGSFDITLEKIACVKRAGIRSMLMTAVSDMNIDEIPDIMDTVVAHKADVFAFARYCPTSEEKATGYRADALPGAADPLRQQIQGIRGGWLRDVF